MHKQIDIITSQTLTLDCKAGTSVVNNVWKYFIQVSMLSSKNSGRSCKNTSKNDIIINSIPLVKDEQKKITHLEIERVENFAENQQWVVNDF